MGYLCGHTVLTRVVLNGAGFSAIGRHRLWRHLLCPWEITLQLLWRMGGNSDIKYASLLYVDVNKTISERQRTPVDSVTLNYILLV